MKKRNVILFVLMMTVVLFTQCNSSSTKGKYKWVPKTGSYVDDSKAIDTLVMIAADNWSDTLYTAISDAIETDFTYGKIKDQRQVIQLYQKLLGGSSYYSYYKVDSLLRLSQVDEKTLDKYRKMNKFLSNDYKEKGKIYSELRDEAILNQSKDLINSYDWVKKQCAWKFGKSVSQSLPYPQYNLKTAEQHEREIKNNKYWKSHFCNNTSFNNSFPQFPARREEAIREYYTNTVNHFTDEVLFDDGRYTLEQNISHYRSLVLTIRKDIKKTDISTPLINTATGGIVDYYRRIDKAGTELSFEERTVQGNRLSNILSELQVDDCGLAAYILYR